MGRDRTKETAWYASSIPHLLSIGLTTLTERQSKYHQTVAEAALELNKLNNSFVNDLQDFEIPMDIGDNGDSDSGNDNESSLMATHDGAAYENVRRDAGLR